VALLTCRLYVIRNNVKGCGAAYLARLSAQP
jgi:hypothetical protein